MASSKTSDQIGIIGARKLVAVVYADMVGYSRLIGLDDAGTLRRLKALRSNLIDPAIEEHGGRIVQTGGDSLLVVFDSIDGAVRCALKVQEQVPVHDCHQPPDRAIRFRVGINLGDAIPDGADLYGDTVNVAARLQAECPPGGICVSRSVRDHVHGRLGLEFDALGALALKNIARPVAAFVLRPDAVSADRSVERTLADGTDEALPLSDKPSIAVLAFTNISGDTEQEYFSDGIADEIITELSRNRSLFVIARSSSFTYKGRAVDVKQVARELGVRYILEGSVRRDAERVRVGARLIDATTGHHLWAERYDRALEHVFAVQDEIADAVVTAIEPALADAELFQQAITLDGTFVAAHVALALAYLAAGSVVGTQALDDAMQSAACWARKAVEIDPNDAEAQAVLGGVVRSLGNADEAFERISLALAINPNSALAYAVEGASLLFSGNPSEARGALRRALQLNPRDPRSGDILNQIAISYYFERDYDSAISAARSALARFHPHPHRWLAAALGQLGRINEAKEELRKAQEAPRGSFELYTRRRPPWFRTEDHEHMLDGLRKAGWQG